MDRKPDIVRIDEFGVARPVDRLTTQRLKGQKGSYRLLPSPARFVLLERVVESEAHKPLHLRLAGEIGAPGMLCDVVASIAHAGWRGELVVWATAAGTEPIARSIFLETGNVLGAQSTAPAERLGELMYRLGVLDREQIAAVAKQSTPERRFGETALDLGYLRRERLYELVRLQAEETFFAAMRVTEGTFWFLDGFDPQRLAYRNHVSAQLLLMEAVRRLDEAKYFHERIPSTAHVPVRLPTRVEPPAELSAVWHAIDGLCSVAEVGRACGLPDFETQHALYQLVQGGFVQITSPRPTSVEAIVEIHNEAIRAILSAADAASRGREVRERLAGFASGVGVYDALFLGAGPRPDGTLDASRVVRNLAPLAGDDPNRALAQWLHDYIAFALFDASTEMPRSRAGEVNDFVAERIAALAPKNAPSSVHPPALAPASKAATTKGSPPNLAPPPSIAEVPPATRPSGAPYVPQPPVPPPSPPPMPALQPTSTPAPNTRPSLGVLVAPKQTQMALTPPPPPAVALFEAPTPAFAPISEPPPRLTLTPKRRSAIRTSLTLIAILLLVGSGIASLFVFGVVGPKPEPATETRPPEPKPKPAPSPSPSHEPTVEPVSEPASAQASAPASASASATTSASAIAIGLAPTQGRILTGKAPAGFRIFVDGRVAGNTPEPVIVPCGAHVVKVGSHGTPKNVFVPCGGELDAYVR